MSGMIQSLESRVLFSSVAAIIGDGPQLVTDIQSARAHVIQYEKTLAADVHTITADVRSVPASTRKQSLLRAIRTDETKWVNTIRADIRSVVTTATANKAATVAAAIRVFHHPTNLAYIAELVADVAKIGNAWMRRSRNWEATSPPAERRSVRI